jgi:hypothetical protein
MRIAYFDCFSGISGDMTIAAFLDAGLGIGTLEKALAKLKLKGYRLEKRVVSRGGLSGTKFDCIVKASVHTHRSLKEIMSIIGGSSLNDKVKETAKRIFRAIGASEAKVHGIAKKSDIRLHELGNIDSIIDIVGTAIAIDELGIDEIYSSNISMGRTFVDSKHGRLPIPAPAALELLKGVPVSISEIPRELVTPTGAGIIKTLSKGFGTMPQMEISGIGYGAGAHDAADRPNMLRVLIGEAKEAFRSDRIFVIEANIDDMSPQNFEYAFEKLLAAGALDVYLSSIIMKKSRPAFKLSVLAQTTDLEKISSVIFNETTTIGVRFYETARLKLDRKFKHVSTKYGKIKVKFTGARGGALEATPEYDECVSLARRKNVPLKTIQEEARFAARRAA